MLIPLLIYCWFRIFSFLALIVLVYLPEGALMRFFLTIYHISSHDVAKNYAGYNDTPVPTVVFYAGYVYPVPGTVRRH